MKTEQQLRDEPTPWPKTKEELHKYIDTLVDQQHDYGTCVYAMSLAATAAFNYVAGTLGSSAFQSSCADMDIIRRTRGINGPFMFLDFNDELYERDRTVNKVREAVHKNRLWLKKEARKKLKENPTAHPDVYHNWARLAYEFPPVTDEEVKSWNVANPDDQILDNSWYDKNREDLNFAVEKLAFIRNEFTEDFVEKNHKDFKKFGIKEVYFYKADGGGSVEKADSVDESGMFRYNFPVSLNFKRKIGSVKAQWSVDTEIPDANGKSGLQFDWQKLSNLEARTKGVVKSYITKYIKRAKIAEKNQK